MNKRVAIVGSVLLVGMALGISIRGAQAPPAGDESAIDVTPDTTEEAISWATRIATILGGALFGLALAGFGWVYVSATGGGRRRR